MRVAMMPPTVAAGSAKGHLQIVRMVSKHSCELGQKCFLPTKITVAIPTVYVKRKGKAHHMTGNNNESTRSNLGW